MVIRDLTIDDFKDKLEMEGSPSRLDILAVVAEKAKEILKREEKLQEYAAAAAEKEERRETPSSCDDGEAVSSNSKRRNKCKPNNKQPPLPEKFEKLILEMARGKVLTPPTLVIQKLLFKSDVEKNHNRFNIPISQIVRDDFLTDDEKRLLQTYFDEDIQKKKKKNINIDNMKKERRRKKYLEVKMIEPSLDLETVQLRQWDMEKTNGGKPSCNYVINGNWFDIVTRNYLTEGMEVQLWCFRLGLDQDLYFALVPLP